MLDLLGRTKNSKKSMESNFMRVRVQRNKVVRLSDRKKGIYIMGAEQ